MRTRAVATLVALGAVAVAILVAPFGAFAGHTNTVLNANLDGRAEVETGSMALVGDPNGRGEVYVFGIDGAPTTLCYVLLVDKIAPATAAHIHEAPAGTNGPVVVNLAAPGDGDAADCLTEGEMVGPNMSVPAFNGTTAQEVLGNPDEYYVNVHNAEYPGGAIRGQLSN